MKQLKFRTPVKCQNGHKALWYWEIDKNGIGEVKHLGVISNRCDCPKQALGEGYTRDGDDQQFIGLLDKNGKEICEGDLVSKDNYIFNIYYDFGGFTANNRQVKGETIVLRMVDATEFEVIGNIYENPELIK